MFASLPNQINLLQIRLSNSVVFSLFFLLRFCLLIYLVSYLSGRYAHHEAQLLILYLREGPRALTYNTSAFVNIFFIQTYCRT